MKLRLFEIHPLKLNEAEILVTELNYCFISLNLHCIRTVYPWGFCQTECRNGLIGAFRKFPMNINTYGKYRHIQCTKCLAMHHPFSLRAYSIHCHDSKFANGIIKR